MFIAEVSKKYELSADTLRYYERIGLIPTVQRNDSGIRNYSEENCNWVQFIKCMRSAGLSIESLVEYVSLYQKGDTTLEARKLLLVEERKELKRRMKEMEEVLERLDKKIKNYEKMSPNDCAKK